MIKIPVLGTDQIPVVADFSASTGIFFYIAVRKMTHFNTIYRQKWRTKGERYGEHNQYCN